MRKFVSVVVSLLLLGACGQSAEVEIDNAWVRDTAGGTGSAAVFMTITSPDSDRLIAASTPAAEKTDLMTMETKGGAMAMAYLDAIDLPAGETVSLDPGGLHVWLAGLDRPLEAGQTLPLTLEFENAGRRSIDVPIIAPAAAPPKSEMPM